MGKVETNNDSAVLCCSRDLCDVEQLAAEKIHRADNNHSQLIGMLCDEFDKVFSANCELTFSRAYQNKRVFRVEPMMNDLCLDRVGIGRERRLFHQEFEARFGWAIERRHHQVKVHRKAVHADHFDRLRANKPRHRLA